MKAVALDAIPSAQAVAGSECAPVISPAISAIVHADREMLHAVLLNLVMNACQSGSSEPIEVRVTESSSECRIEVLDRGAGLGLAIVRRLIALQGGAVTLHAHEGGGAAARVSIPLSPHTPR